jgi:hypothetical protein
MRLNIRFIFFLIITVICGPVLVYGQVDATVGFNRTQEKMTAINISWPDADENKWHEANDGRLDIPGLKVNLHSNTLSTTGDTSIYQFQLEKEGSIELMIRDLKVAHGESLLLKNMTTGEIILHFANSSSSSFITPQFDPSEIVFLWISNKGKGPQSTFTIPNIYFDDKPAARSLDIGFGTSFPCHPNAACKTDSMKQLISKSTVRIRLVMEEGIGWCSGSFINNTRQDKTPYLLSAYHCQWEYTPFYDMWRFDFDYVSPACENPAEEPAFFSMVGCELISLGQASDFLLVKLLDQIPINQNITFAGWDRDSIITPDTSYLIHHPNADIRKFSTTVNKAVIHPNQIHWTEGYNTPPNNHFKFKFTEGGHEPGSSGGPLFNQDFYLVGQLHGGTAGCEIVNNTYIGRLSKSWNSGATPQERLSDWLDPDQTNLLKIESLENFGANDVVDIHGIAMDPLGRPIRNATIQVTGAKEEELVTGIDGRFVLTQVNRSGEYILTAKKNDNPTNGLNALDLVAIQKHLLSKDTFNVPWKFIAADATNNQDLTVGDILLLLRLILGKIQALPSSPSWRFDPPSITIQPGNQPDPIEVQFMGIKIGDLNGTSNPGL